MVLVLKIWNGQDIIAGRIAKLNIIGLPLPLWDKESFDRIATSFGKVVEKSSANYSSRDLSLNSVTILTGSQKIIDVNVRITVRDKTFVIIVSEEKTKWWPMNPLEYSSGDSESGSDKDSSEVPESDTCMNEQSPVIERNKASGSSKVSPLNKDPSPSPKNPSPSPNNNHKQNPLVHGEHGCGPHQPTSPLAIPSSHAIPNPLPTPLPEPTSAIRQPVFQTPSRKRQRCISPTNTSPTDFDLNTPPPSSFQNNHHL